MCVCASLGPKSNCQCHRLGLFVAVGQSSGMENVHSVIQLIKKVTHRLMVPCTKSKD